MTRPIRILSTRLLTPPQKERLLNAGFAVVERSFVATKPLDFESEQHIKRAIITSSNAIEAIRSKNLSIDHCYCVGQKTAQALTEAGYPPEICKNSAAELAKTLIEHYEGETFYFLGTSSRRNELPDILRKHNTPLIEVPVYETILTPKAMGGDFDGVLFFSPSAVSSFTQLNRIKNAVCFCIGPTTASSVRSTETPVVLAKTPTAEHLILETIKYFKKKEDHNLEPRI